MDKVCVVDLGLGNLRSVVRALERVGATSYVCSDPDEVRRASCVLVPGQGAFGDCQKALDSGFAEALSEQIKRGTPYFGICLGMQLLFETSEEAHGSRGLGVLRGHVRKFPAPLRDARTGNTLKVPHMGWNQIASTHAWLPDGGWFYFVHSYRCMPEEGACVAARTEYGESFCAAVSFENVFACQFHPEKSQREGHALLDRFWRGLSAWN